MAASYESLLFCDYPTETLRSLITVAATTLRKKCPWFRFDSEVKDGVVLRTGRAWLFGGERISIIAEEKSVRIISECVFPTRIIDWGKNRGNVEAVRQALKDALAWAKSRPGHELVREALACAYPELSESELADILARRGGSP
jgi:hypothetical protein